MTETTMAKLSAKARKGIPAGKYAFPKDRKEPLENAAHVRNAISRFNQVKDVTDADRAMAWTRILRAAKKFGVAVRESSTHLRGD
jgi:uncharacterized protein DUF6582